MLGRARAMEGHLGSCAALISKDSPSAMYIHCASQSLSDTCTVDAVRNTIGTVKGMITFIRATEKRMDKLKEQIMNVVCLPPEPLNKGLPPRRHHSVCPMSSTEFAEHPPLEQNSTIRHCLCPLMLAAAQYVVWNSKRLLCTKRVINVAAVSG